MQPRVTFVRRSVVGLAMFAALLVGGSADHNAPVARASAPDYTFHVSLTPPVGAGTWGVTAAPATPVSRGGAPEIVNATTSGTVATVTSWNSFAKELSLSLKFRNLGAAAPAATLVVDFVSPSKDASNPNGGQVKGTAQVPSNGAMFAERFPLGAVGAGATLSAPVTLKLFTGAFQGLRPRYDLYYHVETGTGASTVRHGLPFEGTLAPSNGKLIAPANGGRYLVVDTIDASRPENRWADRFSSKFNIHPPVLEFLGSTRSLDNQPITSTDPTIPNYSDSITTAAQRGMVPAILIGIGGPGDPGNWTYQQIADGAHDTFITDLAKEIKRLGYPVIGFLGAEFNSVGDRVGVSCGPNGTSTCSTNTSFTASDANAYGDPNFPDGPERFRDAARRVVDLFDQEGATNVTYAIMVNNSEMWAVGFPWGDGANDPWWDRIEYFNPGRDYVDISASQVFNSYPNALDLYQYPTIPMAWGRHYLGYYDWNGLADLQDAAGNPTTLYGFPDDLLTYGTNHHTQDRSPLIQSWYGTMTGGQFPLAKYFGVWDNASDRTCMFVFGNCVEQTSAWNQTGMGEYGYANPTEIDAFRAGMASAGFVSTPTLSANVAAPSAITDLGAVPAGPGSVTLTWSAPGDDASTGTADHYSFRCRSSGGAVSGANWSTYSTRAQTASLGGAVPLPAAAGTVQSMTLTGLASGVTYTCALKAISTTHHNGPVGNVVTFSG